MAVQQGRSERRGESHSAPYVEPLSNARTPLADFFSILLDTTVQARWPTWLPCPQESRTIVQPCLTPFRGPGVSS